MGTRPHKKLTVWKRAVDFVVSIYGAAKRFPKPEEFGLSSQMKRAAVSLASNIAEGAARQSKKEFRQFLYIAQGSASEIDTQLEIALRLGYVTPDEMDKLSIELDEIGKMLSGLIRSLS
jgi:four helix bundle protein